MATPAPRVIYLGGGQAPGSGPSELIIVTTTKIL
jgi:hypothetical protein